MLGWVINTLFLQCVVDLDTVPDVLGLACRRPEVAVVRVLQGRDARSVRALIPDTRVLERGFHDVAIVDMEDSSEPSVSEDDLSLLRLKWPVTVLRKMVWLQNELDAMRVAAKRRYRHSRPGDCSYCGKWIKCDMYRHVSTYHLDLGQLCPVSWCTMWKGTPQDCMDHVQGAHDVPSDIKSASLEKFFPPWTVQHQIWVDALKPCHSGVSTDVLIQRNTAFVGAPRPSVPEGVAPLCILQRLSQQIMGVCVAGVGLDAL